MNKIKRIILGILIFISGLSRKVLAIDPVSMYAVDPGPKQTISDIALMIGKIVFPIIIFLMGLFIILNKKITNKVKTILILILSIIAIFGFVLINHISETI